MAFARFGNDSSVYVFGSKDGFICLRCSIAERDLEFRCATAADMVAHLREHRAKGDKVPDDAIEEIELAAEADPIPGT